MIFIKTDDYSLVQISGSNIYSFINERFASKEENPSGGQLVDPKGEPITKEQVAASKSHKYRLRSANDLFQLN